jgi:hypothetical protein
MPPLGDLESWEMPLSRPIARRFRMLARLATGAGSAALILGIAFLLATIFVIHSEPGVVAGVGLAVLGIGGAMGIAVALSRPYIRALRRLSSRYPNATVFLIRRRPAAVADTQAYIASKSPEPLPRGWLVVVADERGLSGWTAGREPRELALVGWHEVGTVEIVVLPNVGGDFCVNTGIRSTVVPLSVDLGFASGFIVSTLSLRESTEVVEMVNAHRPTGDAHDIVAGPTSTDPGFTSL